MAGRRRGSRGGGRRGRGGRGSEDLSEEEFTQVYQKRRVSDNFSDKDKTLFGSASSQLRPPRQTTPQIIRTLDDRGIFTSPPRHGTTIIRRFIEDEDDDNPREELTKSTQTPGRNMSPILRTLESPEDLSESHVRSVSRNSTLQPVQAPTPMHTPVFLNSVENDVTLDDIFDAAVVTRGTEQGSSVPSQAAIPSLRGFELHLSEAVEASVRKLPNRVTPTCSVSQKNTSHSLGGRNFSNHNNDSEESASSCFLKACHNLPSLPTVVASIIPESLSRREDNVASSSINHGSKETAANSCAVSNRHEHQRSSSLNTTDIVEQMGNGDVSEANSVASVDALSSVSSYKVKPQYVAPLTSILSKHGDIAANCSLGSGIFRSICLEIVCDIVEDLKKTNLKAISGNKLESMMVTVTDLERGRIEVGWLRKRLDDISEAKKAIPQLQLHSKTVSKVENIKQQLEVHKKTVHDLQQKINSAEAVLSAAETEASELKNLISQSKAKLKHVFKLASLAHDLV